MNKDKKAERLRYDNRAYSLLVKGKAEAKTDPIFGSLAIPVIYRSPYSHYEKCIQRYVSHNHDVLELAAGTGLHTYALMQTGARVVASDIPSYSLKVLSQRLKRKVKTTVADMESLPFKDCSFDVVACAGGLSYGKPVLVDSEVRRVLRPGGMFICVDSLNHNPVYRLNRWVHYLKGNRTKSTLLHMPTMERIQSISRKFRSVDVRYFGAISYLIPVLACFVGQSHAVQFSDIVDRIAHVDRAAFKFVLVACGRL